jgi:hypothetical protein
MNLQGTILILRNALEGGCLDFVIEPYSCRDLRFKGGSKKTIFALRNKRTFS